MSFFSNIASWLKGPKENGIPAGQMEPVIPEKSFRESVICFFDAALTHISAMSSLFVIEVSEAGQRIKTKIVCLFLGVFFIFFTYLFGCAALTVYLDQLLGNLLWALLCITGGHALIGLILLLIAVNKKVGPFAPETSEELKSSFQCLQIAVREKKDSLSS